ncbi:head-tail adaptor protein [Oceaniradius stylonematis]|jgi:head-tail adaptor|uniref:head-tail adaptor protein n=1 Tax=Oceaniradius stylonematis TaxID=2184161 RepID=UPI000F3E436C|nr:head-tail adaptor protein [Oceaniradius stylonematis]RNC93546.1 MAG: head-tail adaptor protein [Oricola sp.]
MAPQSIDPGRLRVRFALEEWASAPDGRGGFTDMWTHVAHVWGMVASSRATDPLRAGAGEQVTERTIVLRADPRVRPAMGLVAGSDRFVIQTVHDEDMGGRHLRCIATSEVPQ